VSRKQKIKSAWRSSYFCGSQLRCDVDDRPHFQKYVQTDDSSEKLMKATRILRSFFHTHLLSQKNKKTYTVILCWTVVEAPNPSKRKTCSLLCREEGTTRLQNGLVFFLYENSEDARHDSQKIDKTIHASSKRADSIKSTPSLILFPHTNPSLLKSKTGTMETFAEVLKIP
jgi:hypothetical protein